MYKRLVFGIVICWLMSLWGVAAMAAPVDADTVAFDEENVVLSFGAVSDLHVISDANNGTSQKYATAIRLLKQQAGGKLDAITVAGDISNSRYSSSIGECFRTLTDEGMGADANVFFVTGNHDAETGWDALAQFYDDQSQYLTKDLPSSQHHRGNRHMVVGGYHFIGLNRMNYWGSGVPYDQQDLEWLDRELAAARADAPGNPIFFYTHAPVQGAFYGSRGSDDGGSLYSHLMAYPEVVAFSGHIHSPIHEETAIYQRDFTALDCGAVQYMSIGGGYLQSLGNGNVSESDQVSNGLLVQVDKDNNLKITRMDFTNAAVIKQPFYVDAPDLTDKTHLTRYTDEYFHGNNTAPVFSERAGVSGMVVGDGMEVTFDAATDDDMVHHYDIEIQGLQSGAIKRVKAFSEFYLYPSVEQFPMAYTMTVPYVLPETDTTYRIALYAVDSMGWRSDPLIYDYTPGDRPPVLGGVTDGASYYTTQRVTVAAEGPVTVYVNGQPVQGEMLLEGNKDTTYTVMAVGENGARAATVVRMNPVAEMASPLGGITAETVTFNELMTIQHLIKDIDGLAEDANATTADKAALATLKAEMEGLVTRVNVAADALNTPAIEKMREVTAEDVTPDDQEDLLAALADYHGALTNYGGNYSPETKEAVDEVVTRMEEALTALGVEVPDFSAAEKDGGNLSPWLWVGIGLAVALIGGAVWCLVHFAIIRKRRF